MKTATTYSVPLTIAPGFGWKWRSDDGKRVSPEWFVFHRDCVADAKRNGYAVEPGNPSARGRSRGLTAGA